MWHLLSWSFTHLLLMPNRASFFSDFPCPKCQPQEPSLLNPLCANLHLRVGFPGNLVIIPIIPTFIVFPDSLGKIKVSIQYVTHAFPGHTSPGENTDDHCDLPQSEIPGIPALPHILGSLKGFYECATKIYAFPSSSWLFDVLHGFWYKHYGPREVSWRTHPQVTMQL